MSRPLRSCVGPLGVQPLREELRDLGLSHREVGEALGVSGATVRAWTVGYRLPPRPSRVKLAALTGRPEAELFTRTTKGAAEATPFSAPQCKTADDINRVEERSTTDSRGGNTDD